MRFDCLEFAAAMFSDQLPPAGTMRFIDQFGKQVALWPMSIEPIGDGRFEISGVPVEASAEALHESGLAASDWVSVTPDFETGRAEVGPLRDRDIDLERCPACHDTQVCVCGAATAPDGIGRCVPCNGTGRLERLPAGN